ncbi:MAG: polysaccharide deacetylase family protein [Candidatus Omnitrophica bacterium]|nr:polysaccharide deacetylase family protein [Candidatus Omnitrophota bacterium]
MLNIARDAISLIYYGLSAMGNADNEIVLLYHSIDNIPEGNDPYKINLKPDLFAEQMVVLNRIRERSLVLTFDDGFENFFYNAFPVILKYNMSAIVFVTTDFINEKFTSERLTGNKARLSPLSWGQLREMAGRGIEIGSHTLTHLDLSRLNNEMLYREISESKKIIEDNIGKKVKYFAYPYGARDTFNENIKQMVKDSGYEKAYTNIMGFNNRNSDLYALRRIRIYGDDNISRFKMKINGAYNWVDRIKYFNNRPGRNV